MGCGCFLVAHTGPWISSLFPIAKLLETGIAVGNFDTYVKTDMGISFFKEHTKRWHMAAGAVAWVPYGWGVMQTYASVEKTEANCGHTLILPVMSERLAKLVTKNVWSSIMSTNKLAQKNRTEHGWKWAAANLNNIKDKVGNRSRE